MVDRNPIFDFSATGVGSVPFLDVEHTCRTILDSFAIPFWPQFVRRSPLEDMSIQYSEGMPRLEVVEEKRALAISTEKGAESELVRFYEHFLSQDLEHFAITEEYAPGFYKMIELMDGGGPQAIRFVKGQTVGPVTFLAGIPDTDGKPVLHNHELSEALVQGLAIKALWQIRRLRETGKEVILFIDEPYLSGFGSAFSPIERHQVIEMLRTVIDYVRQHSEAYVGIHCCGNTDWAMIAEAGPDIINFDAFEYMDYFLLYSTEIGRFLRTGGSIAWGMVPTADFTGEETVEALLEKLEEGIRRLQDWGIDPESIARRSILTPACGMGTMKTEAAENALALLARLCHKTSESLGSFNP